MCTWRTRAIHVACSCDTEEVFEKVESGVWRNGGFIFPSWMNETLLCIIRVLLYVNFVLLTCVLMNND